MITVKGNSAIYEGPTIDEMYTTGIEVNTLFHELNTNKWYYLTADTTWVEVPNTGGGGSSFTPTTAQLAAMNSGITAEKLQADETALAGKVDKETGKGLSANDFTTDEKTKLAGIAEGAEVNVQSDWNQTTDTADDYIKNKPTLGTAAAKNATDTYNATGDDVTTGKAVAAALATLPEPMVFKGSLGTGGTITTLPTASSSNKGYVYKVITAGTYASQSAKVGDTFISDGSAWVLIPSGDEPSGTVTNVAVANGGGLTVSGSPITSSGTITVGHSNSVTAKTSSSLKKFTYDAHGHVTGSSELSTAESNALASGIDSTKVAQIATNENNISFYQENGSKNALDCTLKALKALNASNWTGNVCNQNGVNYTVNNDGSITVSGTSATGDSYFKLSGGVNIGDCKLTGCPSGGGAQRYMIYVTTPDKADTGSGNTYTGNSGSVYIIVRTAMGTVSNLVFKPMISPADMDNTYQQYAPSNAELYAMIQALQS